MSTIADIVYRKKIAAMRSYLKHAVTYAFEAEPAIVDALVDALTDAEVVESVPEGMRQFFGFTRPSEAAEKETA